MEKRQMAVGLFLAILISVLYYYSQSPVLFWVIFAVFVIGGFIALLAESDGTFAVINNTGIFLTIFMAILILISATGMFERIVGDILFRETPWNMYVAGGLMTVFVLVGRVQLAKGYGDPYRGPID